MYIFIFLFFLKYLGYVETVPLYNIQYAIYRNLENKPSTQCPMNDYTLILLLLLLLLLLVRPHDQSSSSDEVGGLLQVLQASI